jgi:hypothetical protein
VEFGHRRAVLGDQEHFAGGRHLIHQGKAAGLELGGGDALGQDHAPDSPAASCRVRRRGRGGAAPPAKPVRLPITACADTPSTPPLHQPSPNRQDLSRQLIREPQQAFAHLLELSARFQTWVDINALERSKDESDGYGSRRCLVFHRRNP